MRGLRRRHARAQPEDRSSGGARAWGHRLLRWGAALAAFVVIAAAVGLALLRLALPFAADYRSDLEQRISSYLDAPVSIGSMTVEWHGLGPRLRLADLQVRPSGRTPLHFDRAFVDLGFSTSSHIAWPLRIRRIALSGLDINIGRSGNGDLALLGASVPPDRLIPHGQPPPPVVRQIAGWLLGIDRLRLRDARISVATAAGGRQVISDIDLRLNNTGTVHRGSLAFTLPSSWGGRVRLVLNADGHDLDDWGSWRGRAYLDAHALQLPRWARLLPEGVSVSAGRGDLQAWVHFQAGHLAGLTTRVGVDGLQLERDGADARFERLAGTLHWRRLAASAWQLDAGDLEVRRAGHAWPASGFSLRREASTDRPRWRFAAGFLRLRDVDALAAVLPLPQALAKRLQATAPRGRLRDVQVAASAADRFRLRARFDNLGWRPDGGVPGAQGLDGRLTVGPQRATIMLDTRDGRVSVPQELAGPLTFTAIRGEVRWERHGKRWRLHAPALRLRNADGHARVQLALAQVPGDAPRINLSATFGDTPLAHIMRYLPAARMHEQAVEGLQRLLQAGTVRQASLEMVGALDAFPWRGDADGRFRLDLDVVDGRLAFAPDWPALTDVRGRAHFAGAGLTVEIGQTDFLGMTPTVLRGRIPDLEQGRLEVNAVGRPRLARLVRLINHTPLAGHFGGFFADVQAQGRAALRFDLHVPLKQPDKSRIAGRLELAGGRLTQPSGRLDLRALQGTLHFDEHGFSTDRLTTRLRGHTLRLSARHGDSLQTIRAQGDIALADWLPSLPARLRERLDGHSHWQIKLDFPRDGPAHIAGVSGLRGTRIDLPAPLGKPRAMRRRLAFSQPLTDGRRDLRLDYGDRVRALIELRGTGDTLNSDAVHVRFGGEPVRATGAGGLHLAGDLQHVDLAGWLQLLGAPEAGQGTDSLPSFAAADLHIDRVTWRGLALTGLHVRTAHGARGWSIDLEGDQLDARVRLPANTGAPLRVRVARLRLPGLPDTDSDAGSPPARPIDPAALPPLDVRIGRLDLGDTTLHALRLRTHPLPDGLAIPLLRFTNDHLRLRGQGRWRGPRKPRTALHLEIRGDDYGKGLKTLGYPGAFRNGKGKIDSDLAWDGAPWQPGLASLHGNAQINLEGGSIPSVDPGMAAHVLGLLSLRALPQILSLNVGKVFRDGYAFDSIRGRVDFDDGNAYSHDVRIDGPSGKLIVNGRTGLVARDYDQTLAFQPQLSTSLPLIGVLSGGPVAGIAVAVVQQLLKSVGADMEKAAALRYRLTGSWDDPKVEAMQPPPDSEHPGQTWGREPRGGR